MPWERSRGNGVSWGTGGLSERASAAGSSRWRRNADAEIDEVGSKEPAEAGATQSSPADERGAQRQHQEHAGKQVARDGRTRAAACQPVEGDQSQSFQRNEDEHRVDDKSAGEEVSHALPAARGASEPDHGETSRKRWARSLKKIRTCAIGLAAARAPCSCRPAQVRRCTSLSRQMLTKRSRRLSLRVPEVLHHPEDPEHAAVRLHEALARRAERRARRRCASASVGRLGREPAAQHRVVDALARGRRDDAGGVAGQHARRVPLSQRLSGFSGIGAPSRRIVSCRRARSGRAGRATAPRSEKPLCAVPVPTLVVVAVREDPGVEVRRAARRW